MAVKNGKYQEIKLTGTQAKVKGERLDGETVSNKKKTPVKKSKSAATNKKKAPTKSKK